MVLILMRYILLLKSLLSRNRSESPTSLPLGSFSNTRVPGGPQARLWRVRRSSLSSRWVAFLLYQ